MELKVKSAKQIAIYTFPVSLALGKMAISMCLFFQG